MKRLPFCPDCKGAHLRQTKDGSLMFCLDCNTHYRLYPVEPPMVLKRAIIDHLRWMMRAVRDKNSKLSLNEQDQLRVLVIVDEVLRLFLED